MTDQLPSVLEYDELDKTLSSRNQDLSKMPPTDEEFNDAFEKKEISIKEFYAKKFQNLSENLKNSRLSEAEFTSQKTDAEGEQKRALEALGQLKITYQNKLNQLRVAYEKAETERRVREKAVTGAATNLVSALIQESSEAPRDVLLPTPVLPDSTSGPPFDATALSFALNSSTDFAPDKSYSDVVEIAPSSMEISTSEATPLAEASEATPQLNFEMQKLFRKVFNNPEAQGKFIDGSRVDDQENVKYMRYGSELYRKVRMEVPDSVDPKNVTYKEVVSRYDPVENDWILPLEGNVSEFYTPLELADTIEKLSDSDPSKITWTNDFQFKFPRSHVSEFAKVHGILVAKGEDGEGYKTFDMAMGRWLPWSEKAFALFTSPKLATENVWVFGKEINNPDFDASRYEYMRSDGKIFVRKKQDNGTYSSYETYGGYDDRWASSDKDIWTDVKVPAPGDSAYGAVLAFAKSDTQKSDIWLKTSDFDSGGEDRFGDRQFYRHGMEVYARDPDGKYFKYNPDAKGDESAKWQQISVFPYENVEDPAEKAYAAKFKEGSKLYEDIQSRVPAGSYLIQSLDEILTGSPAFNKENLEKYMSAFSFFNDSSRNPAEMTFNLAASADVIDAHVALLKEVSQILQVPEQELPARQFDVVFGDGMDSVVALQNALGFGHEIESLKNSQNVLTLIASLEEYKISSDGVSQAVSYFIGEQLKDPLMPDLATAESHLAILKAAISSLQEAKEFVAIQAKIADHLIDPDGNASFKNGDAQARITLGDHFADKPPGHAILVNGVLGVKVGSEYFDKNENRLTFVKGTKVLEAHQEDADTKALREKYLNADGTFKQDARLSNVSGEFVRKAEEAATRAEKYAAELETALNLAEGVQIDGEKVRELEARVEAEVLRTERRCQAPGILQNSSQTTSALARAHDVKERATKLMADNSSKIPPSSPASLKASDLAVESPRNTGDTARSAPGGAAPEGVLRKVKPTLQSKTVLGSSGAPWADRPADDDSRTVRRKPETSSGSDLEQKITGNTSSVEAYIQTILGLNRKREIGTFDQADRVSLNDLLARMNAMKSEMSIPAVTSKPDGQILIRKIDIGIKYADFVLKGKQINPEMEEEKVAALNFDQIRAEHERLKEAFPEAVSKFKDAMESILDLNRDDPQYSEKVLSTYAQALSGVRKVEKDIRVFLKGSEQNNISLEYSGGSTNFNPNEPLRTPEQWFHYAFGADEGPTKFAQIHDAIIGVNIFPKYVEKYAAALDESNPSSALKFISLNADRDVTQLSGDGDNSPLVKFEKGISDSVEALRTAQKGLKDAHFDSFTLEANLLRKIASHIAVGEKFLAAVVERKEALARVAESAPKP